MRLLGLLALVACGSPRSAPLPPANVAPPPVVVVAPRITDAMFQRTATEVAKRNDLEVAGWGTIDFGHLATLRPKDPTTYIGAYLLEGGGAYTLVVIDWDGRTQPFGVSDADPPAWAVRTGSSFTHTQDHHGGYVIVEMGLYQGKVVTLGHNILADVRDNPEPTADLTDCPECPALVPGTNPDYFVHAIVGPTTKVDGLVLPPKD